MSKLTYTIQDGLKVINRKMLKVIAPSSLKKIDKEELECIWIMTNRPVNESESESWTETNEPELGEWINKDWNKFAVDFDGQQLVIICGSFDDEYGYIWNASINEWMSYAF